MYGLRDVSSMRQIMVWVSVFAVAHLQRVHKRYESRNWDLIKGKKTSTYRLFFRDSNKGSPSSKLLKWELLSQCGTSSGNMWGTLAPSCPKHYAEQPAPVFADIFNTSLMLQAFLHHPSSQKPETRNHPLVC